MRPLAPARRALLALIAAVPVAAPAPADDQAPLPATTIQPGTPLSAAELAQILGAEVWKFRVVTPPGATHFEARLTVREKGKEARPFAGGIAGLVRDDLPRDVVIALIPVGGDGRDAAKVRVVTTVLGTTTSQIVDNPLKGLGVGRHELPVDRKDGSFDLIGGYRGQTISAPISGADSVISWTFEATRE